MKQITVFLDNYCGKLKRAYSLLKQLNIEIKALALAETVDYRRLKIVVDDDEAALKAFLDDGYRCSSHDIIAVVFDEKEKTFASLLKIISDNNLNIDSMYSFVEKVDDNFVMAVKVDDYPKALNVLKEANYTLL